MMEPFTLVAWLWMGQRYDEVRIEQLSRDECYERVVTIRADRLMTKGICIGSNGYVWPSIPEAQKCAYCGSLPGRKRI